MYYTIGSSNEFPALHSLVEKGIPIFNDWWSTYIPEHKKELETKIIRHYYFQRIGSETPDQFIWRLNEQLSRIMPYYNQLYASELIKFDPLLNHSIVSSGRSIENLVSKANTSDDKYAKSIRDFVGLTDKTGTESHSANTAETGGTTAKENIGYGKSGDEHGKTSDVASGQEDVITHEDQTKTGNVDRTENVVGDVTTTKDSTTVGTETPGSVTTKTTEYGQTDTGKEVQIGSENTTSTKEENWIETIDDDSSTHTVTDLDESTKGSGDKGYADTPQKELTGGVEKIRQDYLTNYTWTDENSTHKADTTVDTTFQDDQSKEHKGDTKGTDDTNRTTTTDTTKSKGGSDKEVTERSGADKSNTTVTGSEKEHSTKDTIGEEVSKEVTTTDGTKGTTTSDKADGTSEKEWTEGGSEEKTSATDRNLVTDSTGQSSTTATDQTRENADVTQTSVNTQQKDTQETTDKGTTDRTTGFMNVSTSALLEAFRKTFLNIDDMIIQELRDNFMMIY